MKYIKPADFLAVREFQAKYKRIENEITELLTTDGSARTADELNKKLKTALNSAIAFLSNTNSTFVKTELSRAFNEGKENVKEEPKRTVAEANKILEAQGFRYAKDSFSKNTYIELQTATKNAGANLTHRVNSIISRLSKTGDDSIYNVQQAIAADLIKNGVLMVQYANGAKQTISSYAAMAARSARIETTNIGSIGRALQAGTDLVQMTTMPQCCAICGAYQSKVYSISGKDKRFPALFKTVLNRGYALPHPNCRHEFIPYFEEAEDPADVERMAKKSQIKYDSKGNLVDVRWQKDIQAYAAWQTGNRQRNDELHEYERMREYYASKGIDAPYKTLASFRTARRRDELSPAFKAWRYRKADAKQYEEWKALLGAENMPEDVDKFAKIKYNDAQKYQQILRDIDLHRQYTETVEKGGVTDVGFTQYKQTLQDATAQIVGIETVEGRKVESISMHLIDRIIGSEKQKRLGVSIASVVECLSKGKVVKKREDSIKYYFNGVEVSFNYKKGKVIQCNPKSVKKK